MHEVKQKMSAGLFVSQLALEGMCNVTGVEWQPLIGCKYNLAGLSFLFIALKRVTYDRHNADDNYGNIKNLVLCHLD